MEEMPMGVVGKEVLDTSTLSYIKEKILDLKARTDARIAKEKEADAEKKQINKEMQEVGKILEACGLEYFSAGGWSLSHEEKTVYSIKNEEGAKRALIKLFDQEGLFDEYVKIDDRSFNKQVRLLIERGVEVPFINETKIWICKITKG